MVMKAVKQKISAFFLLGVFLFALLHSVTPHTHHTHEEGKSHLHFLSYKKVKNYTENYQNGYCFLPLTENCSFNNHTHDSCLSDCVLHESPVIVEKIKTSKVLVFTTLNSSEYCIKQVLELKNNQPQYVKKTKYKNPLYFLKPLRAPPLLG